MSIPSIKNYSINEITIEYANKPGWTIDPSRCVLLIHDMQKYFLNFYESQSSVKAQLVENIKKLKTWCYGNEIPCIYTAQPGDQHPADRALLSDFWGPGLKDDDQQTGIVDALQPGERDLVVDKWRYSAFKNNDFQQILKESGRDQIIICGVYAHIGILATALEAFMLNYKPFVVTNAVADFSQKDHEFALDYIAKRCGVAVDTSSVINVQSSAAFELEQLKRQVAQVLSLPPKDIPSDQNLQNYGLDSIRLMTLMEQWQKIGVNLEFSELMEEMTIDRWLNLINEKHLNASERSNLAEESASHGSL